MDSEASNTFREAPNALICCGALGFEGRIHTVCVSLGEGPFSRNGPMGLRDATTGRHLRV